MHIFKRITGGIFAIWMLLWFVITILLVAIPTVICHYRIKDEKKQAAAILKWYRIWMDIYLPGIFCPIRKKGLSHFKEGENYVVVCNHNSFVDILVSTPSVPGASKTLAKAELAKIPIFGLIYSSGSILVDRKNPQNRRQSLLEMKRILEQGMHLILYPEGTRNTTSAPLQPFYEGAFTMAVKTQKPVLPAVIFHTKNILPPHNGFYAWPHPVPIHFLEPIPTKGLTPEDVPALKEKVFQLMLSYYTSNLNP